MIKEKCSEWFDRYGYILPFCLLIYPLYGWGVPFWAIAVIVAIGIITNLGSLLRGEAKGIRETSKEWKDLFDSIRAR